MNTFYKLIKNENILVKIKNKNDIGLGQYLLFGWLSFFMDRGNNMLIITNKRILLVIKDQIKHNKVYTDFSDIHFNSNNNILSYQNNNKKEEISLTQLNLEYDDYQYLKKTLNA